MPSQGAFFPAGAGGTIFISCGQVSVAEQELGKAICALVRELTPFDPYYAQNQSSLDGLTKNILEKLGVAAGLIAIMHPRGEVISPGGRTHTRGSLWIEQELAIAAFVVQALKRPLPVAAYIHADIAREGIREQLQLNPVTFRLDAEVLDHLRQVLPTWRSLPAGQPLASPSALETLDVDARIEQTGANNFLILKADREFSLRRVYLLGPSGAVLRDLPDSPDWQKLRSTGHRVPIPKEALTYVWNNSSGPQEGRATAGVGYDILVDGRRQKGSLAVMLVQEYYQSGNTNVVWIKAAG